MQILNEDNFGISALNLSPARASNCLFSFKMELQAPSKKKIKSAATHTVAADF